MQWYKGGDFLHNRKKDGAKGLVGLSEDGPVLYKSINRLKRREQRYIKNIEIELKRASELLDDECISRVFEESYLKNTIGELKTLLYLGFKGEDKIVHVHSKELYDEVEEFIDRYEVPVDTKYKIVAKKVKPIAPMVIFMIPHLPCNFQPISVPRTHLP